MTLEELRKKAEEYAENCRTERERKLYEISQQWGMNSLSSSERYIVSEDITKRYARIEGYIAGAIENSIQWHDLRKIKMIFLRNMDII